jgi:micrococcal nuclease
MNTFKKKFKYYRDKKRLSLINPDDISKFTFDTGRNKYCRVYKVYDGDTISVIFRWHKQYIKTSCRIIGIDTPEIRTKNLEEKKLGIEARDFLRTLIFDKVVKIKLYKNDKYGRPLIDVFTLDGQSIKDILIAKNYAKHYDGGTKVPW